jgi:hypothetical protein
MALKVKSVSRSSDGQRTLVVVSSVRWKKIAQPTRSAATKGIVQLPCDKVQASKDAA